MIDKIRKITNIPVFCKDFITDEEKLYKIKGRGADAVLLLLKLVSRDKLVTLFNKTLNLGLFPVVEVDNGKDLETAVEEKFPVVAVNARDLRDLSIDRNRAISLINKIPKKIIALAFSGIRDKEDVKNYLKAGARGVLIGTSLMRVEDKISLLRELRSV